MIYPVNTSGRDVGAQLGKSSLLQTFFYELKVQRTDLHDLNIAAMVSIHRVRLANAHRRGSKRRF